MGAQWSLENHGIINQPINLFIRKRRSIPILHKDDSQNDL